MRKSDLAVISLIFIACWYFVPSIQSTTNQTTDILPTTGAVAYTNARLLYSTSFDFLTGGQTYLTSAGSLRGLGIENWFSINGYGAKRVWCEAGESGIPMRRGAGTKSLGLSVSGGGIYGASERNELNVWPQSVGIAQKAYVRTWLYLPSDFALHDPGWNWYQITNPMQADDGDRDYPKASIQIYQPDISRIRFNLESGYQSVYEGPVYGGKLVNFPLPRGRWFQLSWFVDRTTGTLTSWILDNGTETLIYDVTGHDMMGSANGWFMTVAKIYGSLYGLDYKIWIDGFEIWDDIP